MDPIEPSLSTQELPPSPGPEIEPTDAASSRRSFADQIDDVVRGRGSFADLIDELDEVDEADEAESERFRRSLIAAAEQDRVSVRRLDAPVRKTFVRNLDELATDRPPMSRIYAGGRSGTVAIKLYLALLWRSSSEPYETDKPARAWATLLGLPDPEGLGTRRINKAMRTLVQHQLVRTRPSPGFPNIVTLLDESGDGRPYRIPSTAFVRAQSRKRSKEEIDRERYFKINTQLWREGHIQRLRGPGLTLLLILLAEQGGEGKEVWFSTTAFQSRYSISHQTRTTGTTELLRAGLLRITRRSISSHSLATTFDPVRTRNVYTLTGAALYR